MGNLAASLANDYLVVDDVQSVTFTSQNPAGSPTTFTINNGDPHDFTAKEVAGSNGFFQVGQRRWNLGANQFPSGLTPKPGDQITDASGTNWEILSDGATLDDFGISWVCITAKAR